jgi:hypothetical protein
MDQTFTLTFGDSAENHVGMKKLGALANDGFNLDDLNRAKEYFESRGYVTELIHLGENAYFLIVRSGLNAIVNADDFYVEQDKLEKDTKAKMYGRVVNKKARHNLCFGDVSIAPNYEAGQGRVVAFSEVPLLDKVRQTLPHILGPKASSLVCEGNYYYDPAKNFIGFHGDAERKRVIGIRVGASFPFYYQWFKEGKPVGERFDFTLNHGDIYVMSEKAVGTDWKKRNILTLRHAAGPEKFIVIKK